MAAPNLKTPTTITGKTVGYTVTDTLAAALTNSSASGKVFKINSVYCTNIDGSASVDVDVFYNDGTNDHALAFEIAVPANATQIIVSRDAYIYLEEGDSIKAVASSDGDLKLVIGYEDIS